LVSGLQSRLPTQSPCYLAACRAVSSDQVIVVVLLAFAFAAGWFARGGRPDLKAPKPGRPRIPRPSGSAPAATPAAVPAGPDPLLAESDDTLRRAMGAARAARAVALAPAGASPAASRSVLRVLDQRIGELEACADRLESARGEDDAAFLAYDRVVSTLAAARRRIDGETVLDEVEAARAEWERASAR
jgi:hypothetical protein